MKNVDNKMLNQINKIVNSQKPTFDLLFKDVLATKFNFFVVSVNKDKVNIWLDYYKDKNVFILSINSYKNSVGIKFVDLILISDKYEFKNKSLINSFTQLFSKKIDNYYIATQRALNSSEFSMLKTSVGETTRKTNINFLLKINNYIYFEFKKTLYFYDTVIFCKNKVKNTYNIDLFNGSPSVNFINFDVFELVKSNKMTFGDWRGIK